MKKPSSVAVLPFPLTIAALFGYGILRFLGFIDEKTHTRFTRVSSHNDTLFGCEGRIVFLACKEMYMKILSATEVDRRIKKVLNFTMFGDSSPTGRILHSRLVSALTKLDTNTSRKALHLTHTFVSEFQNRMWEHSLDKLEVFVTALESLEIQTSPVVVYPPDKCILHLPVFQEKKAITRDVDITGSFRVPLPKGRIFDLQSKHIALAIGGPSGSGKSTLAVSLISEIKICIEELKTSSAFADLELSVCRADLDLGTPTAKAIEENKGWDRAGLRKFKRPWTMELAEEAQRGFLRARAEHNIVIGDLPGRVTNVTELLMGSADAGIIISNDWGAVKTQWEPLMSSLGVSLVSKIRNREGEQGFSSLVRHWDPGRRLTGRVSSLNRFQKCWDPFIHWLALFLLFDILPTQFDAGS